MTGIVLAVLVVVAILHPVPASARGNGALVTVQNGTVRGKVEVGGRTFFGVPYAAPPTGDQRFRPPQPAPNWPGVRDATRKGDVCPQSAPLGNVSEDCLLLNVHTPPAARSKNLPVMVWIHGGAYILGTGAGWDPAPLLANGDVIVVSMNYRLGPFGFMALPGLAGESGTTGNYALLDQQAALRWVRANIAAFGGDARNVTIFGESAGGHSVCMQLISPPAKGLFAKAVSESGGCVGTALGPRRAEDAYKSSQDLAESVGCTDPGQVVACLRGKSVNDLLSASGSSLAGPLAWTPVIDGNVIKEPTASAFASGRYHKVPLISGTNKDEGRLFTAINIHLSKLRHANAEDLKEEIEFRSGGASRELQDAYPPQSAGNADLAISQVATDGAFSCPALFAARAAVGNAGQRVFTYEFSDPDPPSSGLDPFMPLGDFHSAELPYLFSTVESIPVPLNAAQKRLSDEMVTYWTRFARTGDPNGSGTPAWPAFTTGSQRMLRLTSEGSAPFSTFADDHKCRLWE